MKKKHQQKGKETPMDQWVNGCDSPQLSSPAMEDLARSGGREWGESKVHGQRKKDAAGLFRCRP